MCVILSACQMRASTGTDNLFLEAACSYLKLVLRCFAEWFAALALWLCFTFSISAVELLVGAVSAALTDVALETTFRAVPFCFQPRLGMLALARVPSVHVSLALALLSFGAGLVFKRFLERWL